MKLDTISPDSKKVSYWIKSNVRDTFWSSFPNSFRRSTATDRYAITTGDNCWGIANTTVARTDSYNHNTRRQPCGSIETDRGENWAWRKCWGTCPLDRRKGAESGARREKRMRHATHWNATRRIRFRRQHHRHSAATAAAEQQFVSRRMEWASYERTAPTACTAAWHGNATEKSPFASCKWTAAMTRLTIRRLTHFAFQICSVSAAAQPRRRHIDAKPRWKGIVWGTGVDAKVQPRWRNESVWNATAATAASTAAPDASPTRTTIVSAALPRKPSLSAATRRTSRDAATEVHVGESIPPGADANATTGSNAASPDSIRCLWYAYTTQSKVSTQEILYLCFNMLNPDVSIVFSNTTRTNRRKICSGHHSFVAVITETPCHRTTIQWCHIRCARVTTARCPHRI